MPLHLGEWPREPPPEKPSDAGEIFRTAYLACAEMVERWRAVEAETERREASGAGTSGVRDRTRRVVFGLALAATLFRAVDRTEIRDVPKRPPIPHPRPGLDREALAREVVRAEETLRSIYRMDARIGLIGAARPLPGGGATPAAALVPNFSHAGRAWSERARTGDYDRQNEQDGGLMLRMEQARATIERDFGGDPENFVREQLRRRGASQKLALADFGYAVVGDVPDAGRRLSEDETVTAVLGYYRTVAGHEAYARTAEHPHAEHRETMTQIAKRLFDPPEEKKK